VYELARSGSPAAESLKEVWSALDYAYGAAHRTRVRDWRNYPYRVSYIANLLSYVSRKVIASISKASAGRG